MANKRNYIVFDIETTGLHPQEGHEIVQLTATAVNAWDFEIHDAGTFSVLMKPNHPEKASEDAKRVIGDVWDRSLEEGLDAKTSLKKFIDWVESVNQTNNFWGRPILSGYNIKLFDIPFLNYWLESYGILKMKDHRLQVPWSIQALDMYDMTFMLFESDLDMENFKLDSALGKLNMARATDKHDAEEDVALSVELFQRYMRFLRKMRQKARVAS